MKTKNLNLVQLNSKELKETNGGFFFFPLVVAAVLAVGAASVVALGYYNGYYDHKK